MSHVQAQVALRRAYDGDAGIYAGDDYKDQRFLHNRTNFVEGNAGYGKEIRYIEEYKDYQIKDFGLSILDWFELPIEFAEKLKHYQTILRARERALSDDVKNKMGKELNGLQAQDILNQFNR